MTEAAAGDKRLDRATLVARLPELMAALRPYAGPYELLELVQLVKLCRDWSVEDLSAAIGAVMAVDPASLGKTRRIVGAWCSDTAMATFEENAPKTEATAEVETPRSVAENGDKQPVQEERDIDGKSLLWRYRAFLIGTLMVLTIVLSGVLIWLYLPGPCSIIEPENPCAGPPTKDVPGGPNTFQTIVVASGLFLSVSLLVGLIRALFAQAKTIRVQRSRHSQGLRKIGSMPAGSAYLPLGLIGGASVSVLLRDEAMAVARAVPFRDDEAQTQRLDPARTVARFAKTGQPHLLFHHARAPWPVMVLGDRASAAYSWCDLAAGIADVLAFAGLHVIRGEFDRTLDHVTLESGQTIPPQTLLSSDTLVVVCSDGAGLAHPAASDSVATLRRLAQARRILWVDDREPRFWRPQSDVHLRLRPELPVCGPEGSSLAAALALLATGRTPGPNDRPESLVRSAILPWDASPSARRATILGEAMGWAAACSAIQPISVGMADALRRQFYPALPPLAFGRLVALDGAELSTDGLRFGIADLQFLRRRFLATTPEDRQDEIFALIEETIGSFQSQVSLGESSLAARMLQLHEATFLYDRGRHKGAEQLGKLGGTLLAERAREVVERHYHPAISIAPPERGVPQFRVPEDYRATSRALEALDIQPPVALPDVWAMAQVPMARIRLELSGLLCAFDPESGRTLVLDAGGALVLFEDNASGVASGVPSGNSGRVFQFLAMTRSGEIAAFATEYDLEIHRLTPQGTNNVVLRLQFEEGIADIAFHETSQDSVVVVLTRSGTLRFIPADGGAELFEIVGVVEPIRAMYVDDQASPRRFFALGRAGLYEYISESRRVETMQRNQFAPVKTKSLDWLAQFESVDAIAVAVRDMSDDAPDVVLVVSAGTSLWVQLPDGLVYGPWPLSAAPIEALEIVDRDVPEGPSIAALAEGRLVILHARSGVQISDPETHGHTEHAALGVDRGVALLWAEDRMAVEIYTFERPDDSVAVGARRTPDRNGSATA